MTIRAEDITSILKQQIEQFGAGITAVDTGTVVEVSDGIARIHGLSEVRASELLEFPNGIMGMALNLEERHVGRAFGQPRGDGFDPGPDAVDVEGGDAHGGR